MTSFVEDIFERLRATRAAGQDEYARNSENVFANFDRIATLLDQSREEVILTYLMKHLDGIISHVRGHVGQREGIEGRFDDLHVYLLLLQASIVYRQVERYTFTIDASEVHVAGLPCPCGGADETCVFPSCQT